MLQRLIIIAVTLVCCFASGQVAAQDAIGTVSRIQGEASATHTGSTRALSLNASVFANETVSTAATARLEVTFTDNTRLTLGEKAKLRLDTYVFDSAAGSGTIKFDLVGAFRFVSGQVSKLASADVSVTTPVAIVGIRGTEFWGGPTVNHGANGTQITNQYGTLTLTNAAGTTVVTRQGFTVRVANWNTPPGQPAQVTTVEIDRNIKKLSSTFGQNGGVPGLKSIATAKLTCATQSACPELPSAGETVAAQIIMQSTQRATLPTPPRVIRGD